MNATVGAPSALVPGLADELDELVQWCTASDPEQRPVDGNALLAELRHIRTNLSDAELDLQPPAAVQAAAGAAAPGPAARGAGAPPAPARMPSRMPESPPAQGIEGAQGNHTEVLAPMHGDEASPGSPTEVISRTSNPTTVFSTPPPVLPPYRDDDGGEPAAAPPEQAGTAQAGPPRTKGTVARRGHVQSARSGRGTPGAGAPYGSWCW